MVSQKVEGTVTPAQAGVHNSIKILDSRLRGNDRKERFSTFYESIKKWMVESLDKEARRLGVTRQSIIKVWIADRLHKDTS